MTAPPPAAPASDAPSSEDAAPRAGLWPWLAAGAGALALALLARQGAPTPTQTLAAAASAAPAMNNAQRTLEAMKAGRYAV